MTNIFRPKSIHGASFCALLFFATGTSSCITSIEKDVAVHASAREDQEYFTAYSAATRSFETIKNFETRHILTVTALQKPFLQAFSARYQRLFQEPQFILSQVGEKMGFFVVLYTQNKNINALDNNTVWNVEVRQGDKVLHPELIKKIKPKERWQPFFPQVSPWTVEYLVLFGESVHQTAKAFTDPKSASLIFSNADSTVAIPL